MSTMTAPTRYAPTRPGWYRDPVDWAADRWWDDRAWTLWARPAGAVEATRLPRVLRKPATALHLTLTLLSGGLWLPVWIIAAARAR